MAEKEKKSLFHSELVKMGLVQVTVASDVLDSKFKKGTKFVALTIAGRERLYQCENEDCEQFFEGQKGRTFTITAEGREGDATITYVGETMQDQPKAAPAPKASPTNRPPAKPPGTLPASEDPEGAEYPPRQRLAPQASPGANRPPPKANGVPMGATVGMAINQACEYNRVENPNGQFDARRVTEIASRILEIARWLEKGNLVPREKEPPNDAPAPSDNDGGAS